jgi:hypothetical protein
LRSKKKTELYTVGIIKKTPHLAAAGFKKIDLNFESVGKEIKTIHFQLDSLNKDVDLLKGDTNAASTNIHQLISMR